MCAVIIPTHCKRDLDSVSGLQTSCSERTVGGSVKLSGDFTHPAICGFYIASYGKAVLFKRKRGGLVLPRFILEGGACFTL